MRATSWDHGGVLWSRFETLDSRSKFWLEPRGSRRMVSEGKLVTKVDRGPKGCEETHCVSPLPWGSPCDSRLPSDVSGQATFFGP